MILLGSQTDYGKNIAQGQSYNSSTCIDILIDQI